MLRMTDWLAEAVLQPYECDSNMTISVNGIEEVVEAWKWSLSIGYTRRLHSSRRLDLADWYVDAQVNDCFGRTVCLYPMHKEDSLATKPITDVFDGSKP